MVPIHHHAVHRASKRNACHVCHQRSYASRRLTCARVPCLVRRAGRCTSRPCVRGNGESSSSSSNSNSGSSNGTAKPLVVVGSVNADMVLRVSRLPNAGETLAASSLATVPGGKGANQAAAAAKLNCDTHFIGQLGKDANAALLRDSLEQCRVDVSQLLEVPGPSGTALILLQPSGENSIIIVGGANTAQWDLSAEAWRRIESAGALLLQREIPEDVSIAVAKAAKKHGVMVVLDAGGDDAPLSPKLLRHVSVFSPNETELARLTRRPTHTPEEVRSAAEDLLRSSGVECVLVKLGADGSLLVNGQGGAVSQAAVQPPKVVDTTGAGDCFTAAFAVATLEGRSPRQALRFAAAAASICIQREGAQPSMPWRHEVDALLESL